VTLSQQVLEVAESQVGRHEYGGPNRGDCELYQRYYGEAYVGLPWCGDFVGWVWGQVNPDWKALASPSTGLMCQIAHDQGLTCEPRPGAAFVICGVHCGLLHHDLGGGVWKTIEGNSGDAVNWRQRALGGYTIYAPPGLSPAAMPTPDETWYFIEDPGSLRVYGGWDSFGARKRAKVRLEARLGHPLREFRDPANHNTPFFLEDPKATPRFYGGWAIQAARKRALQNLQRKLGRELRPFSQVRVASGNAPATADDLGKVD
jgi:hypothetical protein